MRGAGDLVQRGRVESILQPEKEILLARSSQDVVDLLTDESDSFSFRQCNTCQGARRTPPPIAPANWKTT